MRGVRPAALAAAMCLAAIEAAADSWPNATTMAAVSENGGIVVRVLPGESIGDTYGFAGATKGRYARAQWLRFRRDGYERYQSAELVNPVAPIQLAVADDGTLVTLDNWHNVGYGYALVIYAPDGSVRKRYRLADLYAAPVLDKLERSVSSIWWRCVGDAIRIERSDVLRVDDTLGGRFTFRLANGEFRYEPGAGTCRGR